MEFTVTATDKGSSARAGTLVTGHGAVATPLFMPVGTAGSVKAVHARELEEDVRAGVVLANTYHLYLRPGTDVIRGAGGIHRFTGWSGPVLTDSGGYQVYSLSAIRKVNEEGAEFTSHIDGSRHFFSPEFAVDVQRLIGADIIMAFDECTPYPCTKSDARKSMELTHRWLNRCAERFAATEALYGYEQCLFPIVQGSVYGDLRKQSAETVAAMGFAGNAIGGLSVGEPHEELYAMTELVCSILPAGRSRYLMGVGTPANLLECIALGVDMFDCVIPTRNGRNGMLYTADGIINIRNEKWKNDHSLLDEGGASFVDRCYTKAYLRHLHVSDEILAAQIASLHNLRFFTRLMEEARKQIEAGAFASWKNTMVKKLDQRL